MSTLEEAIVTSVSLQIDLGSYEGYQVMHEMEEGQDRGSKLQSRGQESRQGGRLEMVMILCPSSPSMGQDGTLLSISIERWKWPSGWEDWGCPGG